MNSLLFDTNFEKAIVWELLSLRGCGNIRRNSLQFHVYVEVQFFECFICLHDILQQLLVLLVLLHSQLNFVDDFRPLFLQRNVGVHYLQGAQSWCSRNGMLSQMVQNSHKFVFARQLPICEPIYVQITKSEKRFKFGNQQRNRLDYLRTHFQNKIGLSYPNINLFVFSWWIKHVYRATHRHSIVRLIFISNRQQEASLVN